MGSDSKAPVTAVRARAFQVPTDSEESDGTAEWNSTTLVTVEIEAAGQRGLGYTYADPSTAELIESKLAEVVCGRDATAGPERPAAWLDTARAGAPAGRPIPIVRGPGRNHTQWVSGAWSELKNGVDGAAE